ncbi:hypothetical protein ABZT51_46935 [Streptomyces sp. NPDC005373]|uniref:hypothetical protein n=1 Tax=Streptomyces sp. NPDC005373 TaxID=3156879 RepID=UPI0033A659F1
MHDNGMSRRSLFRTVGVAGAVAALPGTLAYTGPAVASARPALVDPATPLDAQPHVGPLATRSASTLVFSDEFTGTSVDTNKWNVLDVDRGDYWYKARSRSSSRAGPRRYPPRPCTRAVAVPHS